MNETSINLVASVLAFIFGVAIGALAGGGVNFLLNTIAARRVKKLSAELRESSEAVSGTVEQLQHTGAELEQSNSDLAEANQQFEQSNIGFGSLLDQIESQSLNDKH